MGRYPPPELAEQAIRARKTKLLSAEKEWTSWDEVIDKWSPHVAKFFQSELQSGADENRLRYRELVYRLDGKRRYLLAARQDYAYAVQIGRFINDTEFWKARLSEPEKVDERGGQREVRFYLSSPEDFTTFKSVIASELRSVKFDDGDTLGTIPNKSRGSGG